VQFPAAEYVITPVTEATEQPVAPAETTEYVIAPLPLVLAGELGVLGELPTDSDVFGDQVTV